MATNNYGSGLNKGHSIASFLILTALIIVINAIIPANLHSVEYWKVFGYLETFRAFPQVQPLNDHTIMVMGGDNYDGHSIRFCEYINLKDSSISPAPSMNVPRSLFVTLLTHDSDIVAIGGLSISDIATNSIEIFNRKTQKWKILGYMQKNRAQHVAYFVDDSTLLIAGGMDESLATIDRAELFNINTGAGNYVSSFPFPINSASAMLLSNGNNAVFGGRAAGANSLRTNLIYSFNTNKSLWDTIGSMPEGLQKLSTLKLFNGQVLASGGSRAELPLNFSQNIIIENNNNFITCGTMSSERQWHDMAQMSDTAVIIAGGYNNLNKNTVNSDWFNPATGSCRPAPSLLVARRSFKMISMPCPAGNLPRSVVVIGGGDDHWTNVSNPTGFSSVEILWEDIVYHDIEISGITTGCGFSEFTVSDIDNVDSVVLLGSESNNVSMSLSSALPAKSVTVKISLVNPSLAGTFSVVCSNNISGKTQKVKDVIAVNTGNIKVSGVPADSSYHMGVMYSGQINCQKITLINVSEEEISLSKAFFKRNIEFSYPKSSIPLTISPKDSATFEICFKPGLLKRNLDTLVLTDSCVNVILPVDIYVSSENLSAESGCGLNLIMSTRSFSNGRIITSYPNPAPGLVTLEIIGTDADEVFLYNLIGQRMNLALNIYKLEGSNVISADFSSLPKGIYYFYIIGKQSKTVVPLVVN